ncbi:MAG: nucleoside triphosphate pyrophosphohydrolase [Deltaproteobacteria bacterium]|nr:nucleoside triphosphate pyrophosphohydrolase [Deltaproteobacteria bacterium]
MKKASSHFPINLDQKSSAELFEELLQIMVRLRGPQGCPWDKKQNHISLTRYLLEECYEVLHAIETGDEDELKEELGDLLLQVVFHAQIAKEAKQFECRDVLQLLIEKLVRRHPHVFSETKLETEQEVRQQWEEIKSQEKPQQKSLLSGIPPKLPALLWAYKLGSKASHVGFDWERAPDVLEKVEEEIQELKEAILQKNPEEMEMELGDLFFSLAQLARHYKLDPERSLRLSCHKFTQRFQHMEEDVSKKGKSLKELGVAELEELWEQVKK